MIHENRQSIPTNGHVKYLIFSPLS